MFVILIFQLIVEWTRSIISTGESQRIMEEYIAHVILTF